MNAGAYVGVDGCRAGWFFVAIDVSGRGEAGIAKTMDDLWAQHYHAAAILIDIPIGLTSGSAADRQCDTAARRLLTPLRHGAVFSPPCRQALTATDYASACRINQHYCGRKISIQTWNIVPKIKEVDDFMQRTWAARGIVRETHPEICFWAMAGGRAMVHNKKRVDGRKRRLDLLRQIYRPSERLLEDALARYPRRQLAPDDVLDALVSAVSALSLQNHPATLPAKPPVDRCGLPMEMVLPHFA